MLITITLILYLKSIHPNMRYLYINFILGYILIAPKILRFKNLGIYSQFGSALESKLSLPQNIHYCVHILIINHLFHQYN